MIIQLQQSLDFVVGQTDFDNHGMTFDIRYRKIETAKVFIQYNRVLKRILRDIEPSWIAEATPFEERVRRNTLT